MKQFKISGIAILFLCAFFFLDDLLILQKMPEWQEDPTVKKENELLKKDLEEIEKSFQIETSHDLKKIPSKLLFRDPFTFFSEITILKGQEEQISKGSAVMNEKGFIGTISQTKTHKSVVKLLTNRDTSLSVQIGNTFGVLITDEKEDNWVTNLTSKEKLEAGMEVYSSGLTEIPGGLLIGTVLEIVPDELGLIQKVKIKRSVDFNDINYVLIVAKEEQS